MVGYRKRFSDEEGMNRKKLIGIIIACIVVVIVVVVATRPAPGPFADANLEAAVREAIEIPEGPIYPADLESLTTLSVTGYGGKKISDLTGLEHCINLTELVLNLHQITDISPLASLTNLTNLSLYYNQISDISPLADLSGLRRLMLADNQITDISPLANLTGLTVLFLPGNQISDISPLSNLSSLECLYIIDNQISDISPLVDNTGLGEGDAVYLMNNPLSLDSVNTYIPELEARGVTVYYQD
jgi:Leucine-rich repeat (LRR) protein